MIQHEMIEHRSIMAKQSQKIKDKYMEILHVINKYTQILRSRRKSTVTFREFHKVAVAMANVLMPY